MMQPAQPGVLCNLLRIGPWGCNSHGDALGDLLEVFSEPGMTGKKQHDVVHNSIYFSPFLMIPYFFVVTQDRCCLKLWMFLVECLSMYSCGRLFSLAFFF